MERRGCSGEGVNRRRRGEVGEKRRRGACFFSVVCFLPPGFEKRRKEQDFGCGGARCPEAKAKFPFYGCKVFWNAVMFVSQI